MTVVDAEHKLMRGIGNLLKSIADLKKSGLYDPPNQPLARPNDYDRLQDELGKLQLTISAYSTEIAKLSQWWKDSNDPKGGKDE